MLAFLRGQASDRKLRLLACGCCRALWGDASAKSRAAVEAAERYADGRADMAELDRARDAAEGEAASVTVSPPTAEHPAHPPRRSGS
jgi:hypothetical protein